MIYVNNVVSNLEFITLLEVCMNKSKLLGLLNINNRTAALLIIFIRFVMLKDQVQLIGSIYFAGDAVYASRNHIT